MTVSPRDRADAGRAARSVAATGSRAAGSAGSGAAEDQPGLLAPPATSWSGRGSARTARSVEVWISVTIPVPTTTVPGCERAARGGAAGPRGSARLLGTRTSSTSIRAGGRVLVHGSGARRPRRARCAPGSPGRLRREEGVGDLVTGARRASASAVTSAPQRSPSTTTVPESGPRRSVPVVEVPQQVLVGGVPGAQLLARVLGEAGELELTPDV